ncbi:hypothetical protein [Sphingomonas sp. PB4P5]|uniref:hypothetical protein n=1 Tax=Parasphingomonas puruogangriensis TaxID=3096155 RepID=UPI002FC79980
MTEGFNGLSAAEAERLAMLAEEAGEIIQAVGKVLRHGYASTHPDGGPDNRAMLSREVRDLFAVAEAMGFVGDIAGPGLDNLATWERKLRYTHHQGDAA